MSLASHLAKGFAEEAPGQPGHRRPLRLLPVALLESLRLLKPALRAVTHGGGPNASPVLLSCSDQLVAGQEFAVGLPDRCRRGALLETR